MAMPPSSGWGLKPCGWQAHDPLLHELLAAARPDLKLIMADTGAVVQLCTQANQVAVDERTYPCGTTADFLHGDAAWEAWLDTAT